MKKKRKPSTYILLVAVLAVWGLFFMRFFGGEEAPVATPSFADVALVEGQADLQSDSVQLLLDYPDPFLRNGRRRRSRPSGSSSSTRPQNSRPQTTVVRPTPTPPNQTPVVDPWPQVTFVGAFQNSTQSSRAAIMTLDQQDLVIEEGDSLGKLYVQAIYQDSIRLVLAGETRTISASK